MTVFLVLGGIVFFAVLFMIGSQVSWLERQRIERTPLQNAGGGGQEKGELTAQVRQEVQRLGVPRQKQALAATYIKNLVDQEAHKKVDLARKEVSKEYLKKMEEKDRVVQRVNQKYEAVTKSYERLGKEKKQTEAVLRSLADGLIVVNEKGETLLMNPAAEKLLGVEKGKSAGKNIFDNQKDEQVVSFAGSKEGSEEREITLTGKNDQTKKVLRSSSAVIENEFGQTMGMVSVLTDVTRQRELDEMKSKFVASVSHELRTPLNCIQESVSLLLDRVMGEITPDQERVLNLAARNIKRLTDLINDVLDLSKIEGKDFKLKLSDFPVEELVQQVLATFEAYARSKKIKLESSFPPEQVMLHADQDRLTQVLVNLVGNACKFVQESGRVSIEVRKLGQSGEGADWVEISVQDNGPGIPKEDHQKIFEKFGQSDTGAKHPGGTGLGLTICREIVTLHGGRMWVESEPAKGARFAFTIPKKTVAIDIGRVQSAA